MLSAEWPWWPVASSTHPQLHAEVGLCVLAISFLASLLVPAAGFALYLYPSRPWQCLICANEPKAGWELLRLKLFVQAN